MTDPKTACRENSIARFLNREMTPSELVEFETHLELCSLCQDRLTAASADDNQWSEARQFLTDNDDLDVQDSLSFLNPTDNPRMLGRFGGYEIAGLIGQGGMGMVLKGFDESLNRYAAIKVLAPQLATRGSSRIRFAREAQAAAAVVHDNVIAIHGVSEAAGLPYLVMPYVRGESLQKRIDRDGPMTPTEVVRIAHQIASGLAAAHAQGLVHRDIKPANILLPQGIQRVLITDFGLARAVDESNLTGTGTIAGTPQFMSPEQATGVAVDPRSDLFSLGTVMYAMCTGRNPFRAENPYGVLRRIIDDTPRPIRELNPEIPSWLQRIVGKLLEKSPGDRYQSATELAKLLKQCLAHLQNSSSVLPRGLDGLHEMEPVVKKFWMGGAGLLVLAALLIWSSQWIPVGGDHVKNSSPEQQMESGDPDLTDAGSPPGAVSGDLDSGEAGEGDSETTLPQETPDGTANSTIDDSKKEQGERLEYLKRLSNRLTSLRQEGNLVAAIEVEKTLLENLYYGDKDHERINESRKEMIEARLDGDHYRANQLETEIAVIERALAKRYERLDQLARFDNQILELARLRKQQMTLFESSQEEEALAMENSEKGQIRLVLLQIEMDYRSLQTQGVVGDGQIARTADDPGAEHPGGKQADGRNKTRTNQTLVILEDELLDARLRLQTTINNFQEATENLDHSKKLFEKGYVTSQQVDSSESNVDSAVVAVIRAQRSLQEILAKRNAMRGDLSSDELPDSGPVPDYDWLRSRIKKLESELAAMRKSQSEQHPAILRLKNRIDILKSCLTACLTFRNDSRSSETEERESSRR